ncbi:MAG: BlaI/MecI/CopY family transcriptional regulator [Planctomycetota bacterium]
MTHPRPTPSELELLQILWATGPATVRAVHDQLSQRRDVGYTTVLKLLQIMTEKQLVERDESQRSHVYRARLAEEEAQGSMVGDLMDRAFAGSAKALVMRALADRPAEPEELAEIRRLLDELEGGSR